VASYDSPITTHYIYCLIGKISYSIFHLRSAHFPLSPFEWFGVGSIAGNAILNALSELLWTGKRRDTEGFSGKDAEPAFNLIELTGGRQSIIKVDIGMACKPLVVLLMGAVII